MQKFLAHWKTTANGILAFLITTLTILSGFLGTGDLTQAGNGSIGSIHVSTWVATGITVALALCRAWIGLLQQDAGSQLAKVPGAPEAAVVPSHETPDDPNAVVVVQKK